MQNTIVDRKIDAICNIVEIVCIICGFPDTKNIYYINTYPDEKVRILLMAGIFILSHIIIRYFISKFLKNLYTILFVWKE